MDISKLIHFDIEGEKSSTLIHRSWETLGFGTHHLWLLALLFGPSFFGYINTLSWMQEVKLVFLVGLTSVYGLLFFLHRFFSFRLPPLSRPLGITMGIAGALGSALLLVPPQDTISALVIYGVAALLIGSSSAIIMNNGSLFWSGARPERMLTQASVSALGASICYFVLLFLPFVISCALVCILPLLGGIILSSSKKPRSRLRSYRKAEGNQKGTLMKAGIFVGSFGLCFGITLGEIGIRSFDSTQSYFFVALLGPLLASLFMFFFNLQTPALRTLKMLNRVGTPLMISGCILILAGFPLGKWLGFLLVFGGFTLLDLFFWVFCSELVSRSERSILAIGSLIHGIEYFSVLLGFLAFDYLLPLIPFFTPAHLSTLSVIILLIISSFIFPPSYADCIIDVRRNLPEGSQIQDACDIIAERYGLSPRETEVMVYLAEGRSVPYIQEELVLSQSTIKTHIRRIYRKASLKGKQELIDLIVKEYTV